VTSVIGHAFSGILPLYYFQYIHLYSHKLQLQKQEIKNEEKETYFYDASFYLPNKFLSVHQLSSIMLN